jgi:hypothetical protein
LIVTAVFSTLLAVLPVKDTVWWNTPGGEVTEHRDQSEAVCSLMLYDGDGSVTFAWDGQARVAVTVIRWDWQFPTDWRVPVAMQVGDVWLANRADSVVIDAVGHGNAVAFSTDQAVHDLLRPADHIAVRTSGGEMTIRLKRDKVGTLLSRARKCRDAIER